MYSIVFALASIFCYSTLIQGMDNNLLVLAKEALSNGDKLARFCELCDHGAYDENALAFLIKEHDKLDKQSQKSLLPGDEIYVSNPENAQVIIDHSFQAFRAEQMIRCLKISRSMLQQSQNLLIKLPNHDIENNGK